MKDNKRRCATLVHKVKTPGLIKTRKELEQFSGFYYQDIPHFTVDCHRYLTEDGLPKDINSLPLEEQKKNVISEEEFVAYDRILKETIGEEVAYPIELKGVAIGGDGLIAQVWYDDERLQEFNVRLGEKVRKESPSMDFQWGIVKNHVPIRVLNLTRFTGEEDKEKVLKYIKENRNREMGKFSMKLVDLVASDHYIQKKNTSELGMYHFRD